MSQSIFDIQLLEHLQSIKFDVPTTDLPNMHIIIRSGNNTRTILNNNKNHDNFRDNFVSDLSNVAMHINKLGISELKEAVSSISTGIEKCVDCTIGIECQTPVYNSLEANEHCQNTLDELVVSELYKNHSIDNIYTYDDYQTIANQILSVAPKNTGLIELNIIVGLVDQIELPPLSKSKFLNLIYNMHTTYQSRLRYITAKSDAINEYITQLKYVYPVLSANIKWIDTQRKNFANTWSLANPESEYIYRDCINQITGQEYMVAQLYMTMMKSTSYEQEYQHVKSLKPAQSMTICEKLWYKDDWKLEYDETVHTYVYSKKKYHTKSSKKLGWKIGGLVTKIKYGTTNIVYDRFCDLVWSTYGLRSVYGKSDYVADFYLDFDQVKSITKSTLWLKLSNRWSNMIEQYHQTCHKYQPTLVESMHLDLVINFLKIVGHCSAHLIATSVVSIGSSLALLTSPIYVTIYHLIKYLAKILIWSEGQPIPLISKCVKYFILRCLGKLIKFITVNVYHLMSVPIITTYAVSKYLISTIVSKPKDIKLKSCMLIDQKLALDVIIFALRNLELDWYKWVNLKWIDNITHYADDKFSDIISDLRLLVVDKVAYLKSELKLTIDITSGPIYMTNADLNMLHQQIYPLCTGYYDMYISKIYTYELDVNIWQMLDMTPYNWMQFVRKTLYDVFNTNIMVDISSTNDNFMATNLVSDSSSLYDAYYKYTETLSIDPYVINLHNLKSTMYINMTVHS